MKIIEQNEELAKLEAKEREDAFAYERESNEYFKALREDTRFQRFVIDDIIEKELSRIMNLEYLYKAEELASTTNSRVGELIKRQQIVYKVLKKILKPILGK
jgi:hypothetical protein